MQIGKWLGLSYGNRQQVAVPLLESPLFLYDDYPLSITHRLKKGSSIS